MIGRATASAAAGPRTLTVKLSAKVRAKLRSARSLKVTVRSTFADASGNTATATRAIALRR